MMNEVGDDFSAGGKFSMVFLTGVISFEGIRWGVRFGTHLCV